MNTTTNDDSRQSVLRILAWLSPEIIGQFVTPRQREHLVDIVAEMTA